ncbi:MAG: phosphotransferase enzyme family protein [Ktedonobacterales bacterium]
MADHMSMYSTWAHSALAQYAIGPSDLTFLRHNDNLTFHVAERDTTQRYLLRIHLPVTESFAGIRQQPAALVSELLWLEALAHDTSLTVQEPVKTTQGNLIATVQASNRNIACTVLRWIDGEPLDPNEADAALHAERLGRVVALLHAHARSWTLPASFLRPSYDLKYFWQYMAAFDTGVSTGIINQHDYEALHETTASILTLLATISVDRDSWGLMHTDLHPGNYLLHRQEVRPIDFSLCGFGYLLFDLATVLAGHPSTLRRPFLNGYARHQRLSENDTRLLEAFCLLSRMGAYVFMLSNPAEWDWLRARIPRFVAHECRLFRCQKSLLFDM